MSTTLSKIEFGARVRERRLALGMSQEALSDMVGYKHKTSISKIESGIADCGQTMIVRLAEALHTTPGYLVDGDEESIKPAAQVDDELEEIFESIRRLTPANRAKCLELVRLYLADQDRNGEKQ